MRGCVLLLLMILQGESLSSQIQRAIQSGNSYGAAEIMARGDLPSFILVSRQGIEYLLVKATEVEKTDPAQVKASLTSETSAMGNSSRINSRRVIRFS